MVIHFKQYLNVTLSWSIKRNHVHFPPLQAILGYHNKHLFSVALIVWVTTEVYLRNQKIHLQRMLVRHEFSQNTMRTSFAFYGIQFGYCDILYKFPL